MFDRDAYSNSYKFIKKWEGGYVDHPNDRGKATNRGVTQAAYDSYRQRHGQTRREVWYITDVEVHNIYREDYWYEAKCDYLGWPLCLVHFDGAVQHGPAGQVRLLQGIVYEVKDGVFGPNTLRAASRFCPRDTKPQTERSTALPSGWSCRYDRAREDSR